jgi:hypothetical protein
LRQFFYRAGPRIVLRRQQEPARSDLLAWCYEQALRQGRPLPAVFSRAEQDLAAKLIDPRWVGEASLRNLEDMNLGEPALLSVLEMILDGVVRTPDDFSTSGPVAAALELLTPRPPATVDQLAATIACVYAEHDRFMKLRREPWLSLLHRLASAELAVPPASLETKLQENLDAQWIVVDCLGLPLAGSVRRLVADCMTPWRAQSLDFAFVSERTSTEAFYLTLIEQKFRKSFEKIDTVDDLIHQRSLSPPDLARLARAELEIAFKRMIPRLDPAKPVLIFGDHGFRLTPDGTGFTHGGSSTLERLTLVLRLEFIA